MANRFTLSAVVLLSLALPLPAVAQQTSRIAFVSTRDGNDEIYVMEADGSGQTNLTNGPWNDFTPCWSPDGTRIAFASDREGSYDIHVMDADGSNVVRLTRNLAVDAEPSWSPDGQTLVFSSNRRGVYSIYGIDANGGEPYQLTDDLADDVSPAWSPDGRSIAFSSSRRLGDVEIYVEEKYTFRGRPAVVDVFGLLLAAADIYTMDLDGTDLGDLTGDSDLVASTSPSWAPDGAALVFKSWQLGLPPYVFVNLGLHRADLDRNVEFLDSAGVNCMNPAWSPDGMHVAYCHPPPSILDHGWGIWVMESEGGNYTELTGPNPVGVDDVDPAWSPLLQGDTHVPPASWGQVKGTRR
jgi:Tol biopolymer transport system component